MFLPATSPSFFLLSTDSLLTEPLDTAAYLPKPEAETQKTEMLCAVLRERRKHLCTEALTVEQKEPSCFAHNCASQPSLLLMTMTNTPLSSPATTWTPLSNKISDKLILKALLGKDAISSHRTTEWRSLEGISRGHLVQTLCSGRAT